MKKFLAFTLSLSMLCSLPFWANAVEKQDNTESEVYAAETALVAFPGAEGGGMYTTGARGASSPTIYHVTNLNDSGTGSLRDAVSKGNRIVVFDVAGTINLKDYLRISKSNITILGQTSPGDGICISGAPTMINADNVIVRYLRFRMGVYDYDKMLYDDDAFGGVGYKNVIVDHCSMSYANDECCSMYAMKDSTVQWCIITEPLNKSIHDEGSGIEEHGYGGIWGGTNMSYHHNLVSSAKSRFPRVGTSETVKSYGGAKDTESLLDVRNNVFYNWRDNASYGGENGTRVNLVNNYYKEGPASSSIKRFYQMTPGNKGGQSKWATDLAIGGNYYDAKSPDSKVEAINADNTSSYAVLLKDTKVYNIEEYDESVEGTSTNHTQYIHDYPINTQDAKTAFDAVLENAGASIVRDEVDERAVRSAKNRTSEVGTKGIVNYTDWVAMTPQTYSGTKDTDTDGDGMPDKYEDENGLNKNDATDALKKAQSGYYNIEEYANSLATVLDIPPATPSPTRNPNDPTPTPKPTAKPTATPAPTATATPVPRYNINVSDSVLHGTVEVNGNDSKTVTWDAAAHKSEIGGAKTFNINGSDNNDGQVTMYDTTTAVFTYEGDGGVSAKGETNPSISVDKLPSTKPTGSVFSINPQTDGSISMDVYIFSGKSFNIYNATKKEYVVKGEKSTYEGHHTYTFDCTASSEYYLWADGSKVGLKSVSVIGGGTASKAGDTVTISTTPDGGYRTEKVYTVPSSDVKKIGDNEYEFVMPSENTVVYVDFVSESMPTMTPAPTATASPVPTATPSPTPTAAATPSPTPTATASPAPTEAPTASHVATPTATSTPEASFGVYYIGDPIKNGNNITAKIMNNNEKGENVMFIAAAYDDSGVLREIKTEIISASDVAHDISISFSKTYDDIKLFLWSETGLVPYTDVK